MASEHARRIGRELNLEGHDLSWELAEDAGTMIVATRPYGLSHGDRACLALARKLAVPAITADKAWAKVANEIGVEVEVIR